MLRFFLQSEMLDSNTVRDVGTSQNSCTFGKVAVSDLPSDPIGGSVLAADLQSPSSTPGTHRAKPEVVLAGPTDQQLEALMKRRRHARSFRDG